MRRLIFLFLIFSLFIFSHVVKAQEFPLNTVYQIAWSPTGDRIASADYTNAITIWDAKTQNQLLKIASIGNNLSGIRWSSDGSRLAGNSYDAKAIYIWDTKTGALLQMISEETGSLGLVWTADGNQILTGTDGIDGNAEIRRWDIQMGKLITSYAVGGEELYANQENRILAIVPSYKLELHDSTTLESIADLSSEGDYDKGYQTTSATWSSDGSMIASGYLNGMVRIWEVKTTKIIHEFKATDVVFENYGIPASTVMGLAFTSKDTLLSSVSRDGSIREWDVQSGRLTLDRPLSKSVTAADWSPDGKRLAVGSKDGTIMIWEQA